MNVTNAIKLIPAVKDYIWGGKKLKDYGVRSDAGRLAEAWVLSMHPDGPSLTEDGRALADVAPRKTWGACCAKFKDFPVLIKLIDSAADLSVQVHPSDAYALKNEGQYGKTEMWYVIDCDDGAGLYVGFKEAVTPGRYKKAVSDGTVTELMNFFRVKKGDRFFIAAGTVHAIGRGCTLAEVQQNSNLTYRVYDYNRLGADGKPRPLHIEKALAVSSLTPYTPAVFEGGYLADCEYFTVALRSEPFTAGRADSFTGLTVVAGSGVIDGQSFTAGDAFYIGAGEAASVTGSFEMLEVFVKSR
ncbi:MAG: class I mannose-6-phosphate isomerase [Clostridiales bacterium]|jgi:mannose-6-phosphate isomerase|nr:class I mannose-6-phosphate isomerase [Clostridiales bacterium]